MDLPTQISLTPAMGQALARCAMIGYEGAEADDLDLTEAQMDELGTLIDSLLPPAMRSEIGQLEAQLREIREAQPGYGTPKYRGDPPEAVALDQQIDALRRGEA